MLLLFLSSVAARVFAAAGLSHKVDSSGVTIGRKYARTDEIGIPFAVTIDAATNDTVTLRERDTTLQIRIPISKVASVVHSLVSGFETWATIYPQYPEQARASKE